MCGFTIRNRSSPIYSLQARIGLDERTCWFLYYLMTYDNKSLQGRTCRILVYRLCGTYNSNNIIHTMMPTRLQEASGKGQEFAGLDSGHHIHRRRVEKYARFLIKILLIWARAGNGKMNRVNYQIYYRFKLFLFSLPKVGATMAHYFRRSIFNFGGSGYFQVYSLLL